LAIVPYLYFVGYGAATRAAHNGTMPLVVAAQFAVILIAALIVLPLQYFRRKTRLAAIILAPLSLTYLSVPFLPWPTSFAIQKKLSSQPKAAAAISLSYDTEPENASDSAFGNVKVPLRIAGLSKGDILLARDEQVRLLDADGKTLYDDKQYQERDFDTVNEELWPEWRQDQTGDIHTYVGLKIPDTLYDDKKVRNVRVEIAYSLILLKKGLDGRLQLPNGTQNIPGLGACTAGYAGGFKGIVNVNCVNPTSNGQCETYFVENTSTGQRQPLEQNCYPDITPAPLRWVRLPDSILFGFFQPQPEVLVEGFLGYVVPGSGLDLSQVAKSRLAITSYNPVAYFTRDVKGPLLHFGDLKGLKAGKKNYEQSLADYKQSLKQSAAEDAVFKAGNDAFQRKDWDKVITDFSAVIQLNPKNPDAFHNRAEAYLAKAEYNKAIADYDEAIRLDPKDSDSFTNRGDAYFSKADYNKAVADYSQAILLNPKDADALNDRCFVKALRNQALDMDLADCNASLKLAPKSSDALGSRGLVYFRMGRFLRAIADYDAVLQIKPKDAEALYMRGIAKIRANNPSGGRADIASALAMDPKAGDDATKAEIKP
jgi:regulator of sirC expression with transglutaminase-like and TPR domain